MLEYLPDYCNYMQVGMRLFVPDYRVMRAESKRVGCSQGFDVGRRFAGTEGSGSYMD